MAWKLETTEQSPETELQSTIRGLTRTGARAAETLADIPRNILNLPQDVISLLSPQISPELARTNPRIPEKYSPREAITKPLTGQYLEPQTQGEKTADEWTEDFTKALLHPNKAVALASVPAAHLAQWASKEIGIPEEYGTGIKNGVLLLGSLLGARPYVNKTTQNLYNDVKKLGNEIGFPVNTSKLKLETSKLRNQIKDRSFKGKSSVLDEINSLDDLISKDTNIPFDKLWQRKLDINNIIGETKDKTTKSFLSKLNKLNKEAMIEHGKRYKVPQLGESINNADELFAASKIAGPIEKTLKKIPGLEKIITNPALRSFVLPGAGLAAAKSLGVPGLGVVGSSALLGHEFDRLFSFLMNSPKAQQLLANYGKQALRGNAKGVEHTLRLLNNEAEKQEEQGKWRLIS